MRFTMLEEEDEPKRKRPKAIRRQTLEPITTVTLSETTRKEETPIQPKADVEEEPEKVAEEADVPVVTSATPHSD